LDGAMQEAAREELDRRIREEAKFDRATDAELQPLIERMNAAGRGKDSAESRAVLEKLQAIAVNMPMNEEAMAKWIEAKLPADQAKEGRARWEDLRKRRQQTRRIGEQDLSRRAHRKRAMAQGREQRSARASGIGNPLPHGVARSAAVGGTRPPVPARGTPVSGSVVGKRATKREVTKTAEAPLPPAPPLDDWDKHVDRTAERYGFTDDQRTKAQAILRDLRRRAEQYRLSRADDFRALERIEDAEARGEKEKALAAPLNALFEELKQRLDNLATLEQRAKAGETSKPKAESRKPKAES